MRYKTGGSSGIRVEGGRGGLQHRSLSSYFWNSRHVFFLQLQHHQTFLPERGFSLGKKKERPWRKTLAKGKQHHVRWRIGGRWDLERAGWGDSLAGVFYNGWWGAGGPKWKEKLKGRNFARGTFLLPSPLQVGPIRGGQVSLYIDSSVFRNFYR